MNRIRWNDTPSERQFQVYNRRRRVCGTWVAFAASKARAELAKHPGGRMLVIDIYKAKLPHLGYQYGVVVAQVQG